MDFEKHVIDELKNISEKLDDIKEQTVRQDEQIKQNRRDITSLKRGVKFTIGGLFTAVISAVISKFV